MLLSFALAALLSAAVGHGGALADIAAAGSVTTAVGIAVAATGRCCRCCCRSDCRRCLLPLLLLSW